jgi:hypothetical protein
MGRMGLLKKQTRDNFVTGLFSIYIDFFIEFQKAFSVRVFYSLFSS